MKKTLALLLCAASMLALLAGCGSKSTDDKAPSCQRRRDRFHREG